MKRKPPSSSSSPSGSPLGTSGAKGKPKAPRAAASPRKVHHGELLPPESARAPSRRGTSSKDHRDPEEETGELEERDETEGAAEDVDEESPEGEPEPSEGEIASSLPTLPMETNLAEREILATTASDPLRRYLEEIRRYPLLPPEEEFRLAMRLRNEGDVTAAKTLVSANLRLVVKIALEYRSYYSNLLDLIQEGNIGLMKAVSKFDPTKGARLGYYASWWIRSYILKYLLDNFRLVKIGTTQAQKKLFYHLMREKERLEAQGLLTGPRLLAERLNVREKDVIEMEQRLSGRGAEMSLDTPLDSSEAGPGRAPSHLDLLADGQESADDALAHQELLELLKDRLPDFKKQLNPKELSLLQERLLAEEPKTLQEVADKYGLTRERARQIEAKVVAKLRDFLRDAL